MRIRTAALRSLACIGAAAVLACGSGGKSPDPQPTTASLTVVNATTQAITSVQISPSSAYQWGPNQISSPIPAGGSRTIAGIPAGTYDFRAVVLDGSHAETYGVTLVAGGGYTWTLHESTGTLHVVNNYSYPITTLYVSPSSSAVWGSNQLTSAIPAYGSFTLTGIPIGAFDFKAIASNGANWTYYGVSVTSGVILTWTLNTPQTASLVVHNQSTYTVGYLYVTPSPEGASHGIWGPDQLGSHTIASGNSFTLSGIPAGEWDLQAVSIGGSVYWTHPGTPITAAGYSWTLY